MQRWGSTRSTGMACSERTPRLVDDDQLARLELADEGGAHDVEGRRLRGQHPALGLVGRAETTEAEGPEAVGVADAHDVGGVEEDEGEGPFENGEHGPQGRLQSPVGGGATVGGGRELGGQELGHQVAVGGDHAGEHARLFGQGGRVGQVPVVTEGEARAAHRAVDRLGVAPLRRAGGRVAGVAHGQITGETGQGALVEDGGDETHVLHHRDGLAVAHRHPGRFLAAVLQGVDAVESELGHPFAGGVDAEDATGFFHSALTASPS